ncbi:hypothetical protein MTO96_004696 [Rhipicephalus appendiculatus]
MASAGFFAELSGLRIRSLRTDMRFLREGAARFGNWCKYKVRSYKGGPNVSSVFYSASCTASRKGQLSFVAFFTIGLILERALKVTAFFDVDLAELVVGGADIPRENQAQGDHRRIAPLGRRWAAAVARIRSRGDS